MAKESAVKALVRLQFDCRAQGKLTKKIVSRAMEASQTAKSIKVKTMDTTIRTQTENGSINDVSGKCIDCTFEVLNFMGVSRPIINYVIFCHQEDSNWPLEEGMKVKEKFDEIFNSIKYQKCLKQIKDVRKLQMDEGRKEKTHMGHYQSDKEYAEKLQKDLFSRKTNSEALQNSMDRIDESLKPILEGLKEVAKDEEGFGEIQKKLAEAETGRDHVKKEKELLEKQITEILPESMDEVDIETKRNGIEKETKKSELEIKNLNEVVEEHDQNIRKVDLNSRKNAAEIGKAMEAKDRHKDNINEKDSQIMKISDELGIHMNEDEDIFHLLEKEEKRATNQTNLLKAQTKEKENTIGEEIDSLKSKKTGFEERKKREQHDLMGFKKEIAQIKRQLNDLDGAAEKLERIKKDWEQAGARLEEEKTKHDLKSLSEEIDQERETIKDLEREENKVREERKALEEVQTTLNQISHIEDDIKTKQEKVTKLMNKRQNEFLQLFESVPSTKRLKALWKDNEETSSKKMEEIKAERAKLEAEKTAKKNSKKDLKRSYDQKMSRLQTLESKISEVLGPSEDLDEEIEKVTENLEKSRKELQVKEAGKFTYREMIERMQRMDCPACPTCNRAFIKKDEATELISDLEELISLIPSKVKNLETKVKNLQRKLETLQKIRPEAHEMASLKKDVEESSSKLSLVDKDIKSLETRLEEGEEDWSIIEMQTSLLKQVSDDVQMIDNLSKEVSTLTERKEELGLTIIGGKGRDIKEVRAEEDTLTKKIKIARKNLDQCQETVSKQTSLINELESRKNKLTEKKLEIEGQQQQRSNMMEKKDELERKVGKCEAEVRKCDSELGPVKEELEQAEERKRKCVKQGEEEVKALQMKERKIERFKDNLLKLEASIQKYIKDGQESKLAELKKLKSSLEAEATELQQEKKETMERISKLKLDVSNQESRRRMFDDNLRLREYISQESRFTRQVEKYKKQMDDADWEVVSKRKTDLTREYQKLHTEKSAKEGQKAEIERNIKSMETELKQPKWKNAAMKYKEMAIKTHLRLKVAADLDKYYRALDFAIMRFHKEKMKVINKIIRELWKSTYKGNDIDYIEIKANEENEQSTGADKKKTYNYRVVMIKGGTELDMRGRCSAGQKVLSSLIIRLALAETFSTNCGIIALDEPTTNLDRENIESLAEALAEIVEKRAVQRNFQLVVITHDEDFIEQLARNDKIHYYQRVSRDENGLSLVKKCNTSGT